MSDRVVVRQPYRSGLFPGHTKAAQIVGAEAEMDLGQKRAQLITIPEALERSQTPPK